MTKQQDYYQQVAEWIDSWGRRLERASREGIDLDGWKRHQQVLAHLEQHHKITPGHIEYWLNRDKTCGDIADYNTKAGLHRRLGTILPAPLDAIVLSDVVDWSINCADRIKAVNRIQKHSAWRFDSRSHCWRRDRAPERQRLTQELFDDE